MFEHLRRQPRGRIFLVSENTNFLGAPKPREEALATATMQRDERGVIPFETGAGERPLHRTRMRDDFHMLRAKPLDHQRAHAKEHRIAGREDADVVLVGGFGDSLQRLREAVLENHPHAAKLREKSEMTFAAREHLRRRNGAHCAAGKSDAAVVTDPDNRYRARAAHADTSVERSSRAWTIATATVLPPLRPRATMYGVGRRSAASFDSAAETNPTGTPITSDGRAPASSTRRTVSSSAVGALPTATIAPSSRPLRCAFRIASIARVLLAALAAAITSSSEMKQCVEQP